jgi:hypothetical protein
MTSESEHKGKTGRPRSGQRRSPEWRFSTRRFHLLCIAYTMGMDVRLGQEQSAEDQGPSDQSGRSGKGSVERSDSDL